MLHSLLNSLTRAFCPLLGYRFSLSLTKVLRLRALGSLPKHSEEERREENEKIETRERAGGNTVWLWRRVRQKALSSQPMQIRSLVAQANKRISERANERTIERANERTSELLLGLLLPTAARKQKAPLCFATQLRAAGGSNESRRKRTREPRILPASLAVIFSFILWAQRANSYEYCFIFQSFGQPTNQPSLFAPKAS